MTADIGENRQGIIMVKGLHTGGIYTFSVGWQTSYYPRRYPSIGAKIKVYYRSEDGGIKAMQVQIE